ncbi:MAG: cobalamin B12-binding domain-containing protein [Candidatus Schekmanbacteria bacterium]|nr:cobalamin B12-binding domain-containing protein [Candidatus Schekmanbacteria bacterium]
MRILLISANRERLPDPVYPIGLASVAAPVVADGHQVTGIDLCFESDPVASLRAAVRACAPDIVGIGIRNIDNVNMLDPVWYLPEIRTAVECVQQEFSGPIIAGGSGFTLMPREILEYLGLDIGVSGEGEATFREIVRQVSAGGELGAIPGVVTRRRREAEAPELDPAPVARIPSLDELPAPFRPLFDLGSYYERGGMANLQTRRGCPFRCIYCTYPLVEGRRMRLRSPALVADEMERLGTDFGVRHFYFVDNVFTYPPKHAVAICEEIVGRNLQVSWGCFGQPHYGGLELFRLMKRAGCSGIDFGIDTAVDDGLANMGKNFDAARVAEITEACREADLPCCHSLLLGGPTETAASLAETLRAMEGARPTAVIVGLGIRVYPRTRIQQIAVSEGIVTADSSYLAPVFYLSPHLDAGCLDIVREAAARNRSWIVPGMGINFSERIQQRLRGFGVKGPLWEYFNRIAGNRRRSGRTAYA